MYCAVCPLRHSSSRFFVSTSVAENMSAEIIYPSAFPKVSEMCCGFGGKEEEDAELQIKLQHIQRNWTWKYTTYRIIYGICS